MRKCPPGVICMENFTIFGFVIMLVVAGYFFLQNQRQQQHALNQNINIYENDQSGDFGFGLIPSYPYNNLSSYSDPLRPPLRDERYVVPINVSTSAVDTSYRQIGILTPLNGSSKDNILPLMGRPLFTRRSMWQYYTISNQHNNVKLPVSVKGKSGLNDNGVDEIYSDDTVYVEGYNEPFKVTKYENDTIKYLPF
jgi:hypothetical protein